MVHLNITHARAAHPDSKLSFEQVNVFSQVALELITHDGVMGPA